MTGEPVDELLHRLAARQHGIFSRSQGLTIGADDRLLSRRTMAGRLERIAPGVYRVPGYPSSSGSG